jgi:hypothetical protein
MAAAALRADRPTVVGARLVVCPNERSREAGALVKSLLHGEFGFEPDPTLDADLEDPVASYRGQGGELWVLGRVARLLHRRPQELHRHPVRDARVGIGILRRPDPELRQRRKLARMADDQPGKRPDQPERQMCIAELSARHGTSGLV